MNKDVIYIEPEDDITDILANIENAKCKIVALVPPKKPGVLRSAVNFRLIAKKAAQRNKTVVLITTDESLLRLANSVKMPTAKSLQSKPHLPTLDDVKEFGEEDTSDEIVDEPDDESEDEGEEEEESEEVPVKHVAKEEKVHKEKSTKTTKAAAVKSSKKDDVKKSSKANKEVGMEVDDSDINDDDDDKKKKSSKKNSLKIPNLKKNRSKIIAVVVVLVALFGFGFWASVIAPAVKISVKVKTSKMNFAENVSFVTDESKADPKNGIFYVEQKEANKTSTSDFQATGQLDKGTKAAGTITVIRAKNETVDCNELNSNLSIPSGTIVRIGGKEYVTTEAGSANADDSKIGSSGRGDKQVCFLKEEISSGKIQVIARENGDSYNISAATNGTLNINTSKKYTVSSSAMTGGSSRMVTVISQEDIDNASMGLTSEADTEARQELIADLQDEYVIISESFKSQEVKTTTSPAINEEVGEGITPKILRENKYTVWAVKRVDIDEYIKGKVASKLGDDTQTVYNSGVVLPESKEGETEKDAFFSNFKEDALTAKLKSVAKTGPRVTEDIVKEKALGEKIGKVQSNLRSINGVSSADVETSYPWVTSVPADDNKVQIEITVE